MRGYVLGGWCRISARAIEVAGMTWLSNQDPSGAYEIRRYLNPGFDDRSYEHCAHEVFCTWAGYVGAPVSLVAPATATLPRGDG